MCYTTTQMTFSGGTLNERERCFYYRTYFVSKLFAFFGTNTTHSLLAHCDERLMTPLSSPRNIYDDQEYTFILIICKTNERYSTKKHWSRFHLPLFKKKIKEKKRNIKKNLFLDRSTIRKQIPEQV